MRSIALLLFVFLFQPAAAQDSSHTKVPGTKYSLIPPKDFVIATSFGGFQNTEAAASIMLNELPAPYQTMADGFTAGALKTKGIVLISKKLVDFNKAKATLIYVSQEANGTNFLKQLLVFGDKDKTVMVTGVYPATAKALEKDIIRALLSTTYDASQADDPLQAATFSIDVSGTAFKFTKYLSGMLLYSTDGTIPTTNPVFIVGSSLSKVTVTDKKVYAQERLRKHANQANCVIKETNEITIDNLNGYEIVADGKTKDGNPELLYQVMLYTDGGEYFIFLGESKDPSQTYLDAYRMIAQTFKRK